ncbi:serine hydrolase domain-containing protein [Cellulomonas fengjieae]|uniref:Serine hydrolase n=1 Tax=Cellulomonas fengjieae TaxID=2819978 RepID=A0ABS3SC07_9CELL|nr:serine hydrolase [Cellulomonas fengjieae]MBO3083177.1 serine hydrolase [Cellulomonas fengjieae]MBO3102076.1 serine hydrolase [Cellulomonas fengjieae]QVI65464.1 serine hydrolase [Cellulomonas fengjieae]
MPGQRRLPRSAPEEQGVDPRALLRLVDALVGWPELHSVMVLRHGAVVAEGWAAPFAPDRLHELYSLSKSFTSTAVGFAVAEGLLTVDDLVLDHFPDEAPADPGPNLRRMRVRDLLTMTTGHPDDPTDRLFATGTWVKGFLAEPVVHEPGTFFTYNTAATYVLSALVQKATGLRLLDYLGPRLFAPLGIEGATWQQSPTGVDVGGSGMSATTEDVAVFGQLYLQDGVWDGQRVLPEGWVAEATRVQVRNDANPDVDWAQGYGYQFWRGRHGSYRGDGAFGQFCVVLPDQGVVVAITSGVADMHAQLALVWEHLLPGLSDGPVPDDPEGRRLLTERLAGLRLDPPHGAPTSPTGTRLDGRTISFEPNTLGIRNAVLETGDGHDRLTVDQEEGTVILSVGHAEPVLTRTTLRRPDPEDMLVSGTWTSPDTYVLTARFVESPFVVTATATVTGDQVAVDSGINVSFGPTTAPQLTGTVSQDEDVWIG